MKTSIFNYTINLEENRIIFLDFDGVLNTHQQNQTGVASCSGSHSLDRYMISNINSVLISANAFVVVISAWRYMILNGSMTICGFDQMLRTHGFAGGRLIGITGSDEENPAYTRSDQITEWMKIHGKPKSYVVVDDSYIYGHPFIQVACDIGFTFGQVELAIRLLLK